MVVAEFASLVSAIQVVDRARKLHDQGGKILLDTRQIEVLRKRFASLLFFLKKTNSQKLSPEIEALIGRIPLLTTEVEYILDKEIETQFSGSESESGAVTSLALDDVIQEIGSIDEELNKIVIEETDSPPVDHSDAVIENVVGSSNPDSPVVTTPQSTFKLVGFEDRVSRVIDKLTDDDKSLKIITIVGMGGIGKTSLARSVYDRPNIQTRFDRHMWSTISQQYDSKRVLQDFLEVKSNQEIRELGDQLHKKLHGRRYLIVLDDIWDVEAWESLKVHLPDNGNGSRVIVTTRNSNVAGSICTDETTCALAVLDNNKSWDLLRKKVFGETGCCPDELKEIGEDIARSCKGLPLSLVTIGGVLSKSDMTVSFWQYVAKNVRTLASSADDSHCLKVLSLSYHCLPIHLKPCFLYMRKYREDEAISPKDLTRRWIAEGFIEPQVASRTIEDIAGDYLKELTERNLFQILTINLAGKIRRFGVHDLVRELCIRESSKESFVSISRIKILWGYEYSNCLICRCDWIWTKKPRKWMNLESLPICEECRMEDPSTGTSRLDHFAKCYTTLRLVVCYNRDPDVFPVRSLLHFWNIQFLEIEETVKDAMKFLETIWKMSHLRYLDIPYITLHEPSSSDSILSELQKLCVSNLPLSESLISRISNLKELKLTYDYKRFHHSLHLLEHFDQLQSLSLQGSLVLKKNEMKFPMSLKKLTLGYIRFHWDEMMTEVGSLPDLQVLKLLWVKNWREWNMGEGGFPSLKALVLICIDLRVWRGESHHLPVLEKLLITEGDLEIPSELGNIDTLNSIRVDGGSDRNRESVVQLVREQIQYGNEMLQVYLDGELLQEHNLRSSRRCGWTRRLRVTHPLRGKIDVKISLHSNKLHTKYLCFAFLKYFL